MNNKPSLSCLNAMQPSVISYLVTETIYRPSGDGVEKDYIDHFETTTCCSAIAKYEELRAGDNLRDLRVEAREEFVDGRIEFRRIR